MAGDGAVAEVRAMKVISYGGGVQSTALLVLAGTGRIRDVYDAVFANTGADSEHPATLAYIEQVARPWAEAHGVTIHEVAADGPTLHQAATASLPATPLPLRMGYDGPPGNRTCTRKWKADPVSRWLKDNGASKNSPADLLIGISTDEMHRATTGRDRPHERRRFPLLDQNLDRAGCQAVIAYAGLPVPPKSSCWFCPFKRTQDWAELRHDRPDLYRQVIAIEDAINAARPDDPLRFARKPLAAIQSAQDRLFVLPDEGAACDEGYCWT